MRALILVSLLAVAAAFNMSPEDIEYQKLIWENDNVIEGDILVLPTSERLAATSRAGAKWPNKIIPYNIDSSLDFMRSTIVETIRYIQNNTCLRFRETQTEKARVSMIHGPGVCNSYVGYLGVTQPLKLDDFCNDVGSVSHEILHAAGFKHEHMRSDRDSYIKINWQNINSKYHSQFKKLDPSENILLNTFDFDSVMLYGPYNGANKPNVKAMESVVPGRTFVSPDQKRMSRGDIEKVNEFYGC